MIEGLKVGANVEVTGVMWILDEQEKPKYTGIGYAHA